MILLFLFVLLSEIGEDCDKTGGRGREPGLMIQQLEPVVNMNGFTHNGKTNGYVPHPINITSNPLAESQQAKVFPPTNR